MQLYATLSNACEFLGHLLLNSWIIEESIYKYLISQQFCAMLGWGRQVGAEMYPFRCYLGGSFVENDWHESINRFSKYRPIFQEMA